MKKFTISHLIALVLLVLVDGCIREDVLLPPVITSLNTNPITSGEVLTINGNNFDPTSLVVGIGENTVSPAGTPSLTEVKIIIPVVETSKETRVYVQTKFGKSSEVSLTIRPPNPVISKVIPDKGGIGTKVKVAGRYFGDDLKVYFKSPDQSTPKEALSKKLSADTLEVTVPAGLSPDAADLSVSTSSGESQIVAFTVLLPPVVLSFTPEKGGAGSIVRLIGERLSFIDKAKFGAVAAEILTVKSDLVELRVPSNAPTDTIHVSGPGGNAKTGKKFEVTPGPVIDKLDKLSASVGADVTIEGQNFLGAFSVKFANTSSQIISNTGTVIKTKVPASAGSGKISVTTPAGVGYSEEDFAVQGTPIISSFFPKFGGIGTKITLTGANLLAVTIARIGSKDLKINSKTDTQMEVEILAGSVTGKISVISPGNTFETSDNFIIAGTPQVTSFNPTSGTIGTVVTITGINFPGAPDVIFNGGAKAVVSKATPTEIVCQVPSGATTGIFTVNGANSPSSFAISAKPLITSISHLQGGVDKEITITGTYFTGAVIRFFNNVTATKVGAGTDNQVVVKVPAGAATGKISVTNAIGSTLSAADFQIIPAPTISNFTPSSGPVGTPLTITGTNLQFNPEVRFFNNVIAPIKSASATQILVDVPAGATNGKISLKTDAITIPILTVSDFQVLGKPSINSIVPSSGTIGTLVAINGTNLSGVNTVSFDGVTTTAIEPGATNLKVEVRVPDGVNATATRAINVNVQNNVDVSNNQVFTLIATPDVAKLSPGDNPVTWPVLIEGSNLSTITNLTIRRTGTSNEFAMAIDYKASNALTTKVPSNAPVGNCTIRFYYTPQKFIERPFVVLAAPPPGAFPPPFIIIPPPPAVNYIPSNVDADWPVLSNENNTTDPFWLDRFSLRLDTDNDGEAAGLIQSGDVDGSFTGAEVEMEIDGENYIGQFYNNNSCILLINEVTGRQLVIGFSDDCICQVGDCTN